MSRARFLDDLSLSALNAGFVTVMVGFTSSAVIVFQAAQALGAGPAQVGSWMLALGLGMGISGVALALRYRMPIATAWSTSGAAMLITSASGVSMPEAMGAFMLTGVAIALFGFLGWFERLITRIPMSIAAGMLSGILLRFGVEAFSAMKSERGMVLAMFAAYLLGRRLLPRYTAAIALLVGIAIAGSRGLVHTDGIHFELARPVLVVPSFSLRSIIGVALPLFAVTMASQNVPGITVLRTSGFDVPVSPVIGWTGVATLLLSPFGAFSINLATITGAICTGREAHEDPSRRYVAAVAASVLYALIGLFGGAVGAVFAAFPRELVVAIAGLSLLGTIGNALGTAFRDAAEREPALITFLVTASGLALFGVGSAFWGLVAGAIARVLLRVPPTPALVTSPEAPAPSPE